MHFERIQMSYIAVKPYWFTEPIGTEIARSYFCFAAKTSSGYYKISYWECEMGDVKSFLEKL